MRRHELSDAQWGLIAVLMPCPGRRGGGRWRDHRQVVNGLMWKLATGAEWRDLPERYRPWQTAYGRFSRWRREGLFDRLLDRLRLKLNTEGRVDLDLWCLDSTWIRASRRCSQKGDPEEPKHHALGLSRGGIGTKIPLVSDGCGLTLAFTPLQRHSLSAFQQTLKAVRLPGRRGRPRTRPKHLAGDKAGIDRPVFAYLRRHGIRPFVPPRRGDNMSQGCPHAFDLECYRKRNAIERCVGWLKGCRSIATRHETLAVNFTALVKLAVLRQSLRTLRPSDRT